VYCYYVPVTGGVPQKGDTITVTGKLSAYNGAAQFEEKQSVATLGGAVEEPTEPSEPATESTTLATGDKVVIYAHVYNIALSATKTGYYNVGVDVSGGFDGITEAEIWTVTVNEDGSYTFVSGTGSKLALAAEYSSLNDTGANDTWELIAKECADGIFYLKNVVRGNYLEWYAEKNNWSSYATSDLNDLFELTFHKVG
jgi:hypothetical protein